MKKKLLASIFSAMLLLTLSACEEGTSDEVEDVSPELEPTGEDEESPAG